jgi:CxxC-x17-CxxC domain-containing protein
MGYSNKHNKFGGGRSFNRDNVEGDRREGGSFKAVCSKCGKQCELPFKPNGTRPVYCAQCFRTNKPFENERSHDRSAERNFDKPRDENRHSYDNRRSVPRDYKNEFETLNAKLDRILKMITPANMPKLAPTMEQVVPVKEAPQAEEKPAAVAKPKKKAKALKKTIAE